MANNNFSLAEFVKANRERPVGCLDYLQLVSDIANLPTDFFSCLVRLISPEFIVRDGRVYIEFLFNEEKFNEHYNDLQDPNKCQFWMNAIELRSLFEMLSEDEALHFADFLVQSWKNALNDQQVMGVGQPKLIHDIECEEVFVSIY